MKNDDDDFPSRRKKPSMRFGAKRVLATIDKINVIKLKRIHIPSEESSNWSSWTRRGVLPPGGEQTPARNAGLDRISRDKALVSSTSITKPKACSIGSPAVPAPPVIPPATDAKIANGFEVPVIAKGSADEACVPTPAIPFYVSLNTPEAVRVTDAGSEIRDRAEGKFHPPDHVQPGKKARRRRDRWATRPDWQPHDLLTTEEAADYLGLSPSTLRNRRVARCDDALPFVRLGHSGRRRPIRYRFSEILAFVEAGASTSDIVNNDDTRA